MKITGSASGALCPIPLPGVVALTGKAAVILISCVSPMEGVLSSP